MIAERPLLAARNLSFRPPGRGASDRTTLGPLDLAVVRGEILAVIGKNGAGKTTLLRLLAGLLTPETGEVMVDGSDLGALRRREVAQRVAYVPQLRPADLPLTVWQLVLQGRFPHLSPVQLALAPDDFDRARAAMVLAGVEHLAERRLTELSGGERQAAFIAAALAQEAEILLLDEPTTHLDASHQRDTVALLRHLRTHAGRTVVLATHDLNAAAALADRLVALSEGRIAAEGTPHELLTEDGLATLFGASFEVLSSGGRLRTLLRFGSEVRE